MRKIFCFLLFAAALLSSSCGDSIDYEYSDYHPSFTFHNETHQDPILATAMNPLSSGVFCIIKYTFTAGRYGFTFENNQGQKSEDPVWFNGIDLRLESQKRIGMSNGLIVGYGNLDNPAIFYAYDLQCPNCFSLTVLPLHPYELTLSGTGIARCAHCKRSYNLNTGGNIVAGDAGKKLTRYRASTSGAFGVLAVH